MKIKLKYLLLSGLFFLSIFLSYKLVYFVGEKYFFDKLIYQKSIKYGYWIPNKNINLESFGERSEDTAQLINHKLNNKTKKYLNIKYYKIAIIGDSFVFGQGILNNERFSKLLENKLNRIRPTRIFTFANSGDNVFDNYKKYIDSKIIFGDMDLYIFGLVNNDLLLNEDDRYETRTKIIPKLLDVCNSKIPVFYKPKDPYSELVKSSINKNSTNICLFDQIKLLFPKENAIYFNFDTYRGEDVIDFIHLYKINNFNLLSPTEYRVTSSYRNKDKSDFFISQKDGHPSFLANKLFADTLFKEIISNPKWKFIK